MTALTLLAPRISTDWLAELRRRKPALAGAGLLLLAALLPLGLAGLIDTRTLAGVSVWDKPMRFAFALGVYLLTLAFFAGWIEAAARRGRLMRWTVRLGIGAVAFEQIWIVFQASRGVGSHFNTATAFESAMWAMMGVMALVLTAMSPVVGWLVWRRPTPGLAPALRAAAALGLVLAFPLTLVTAGTLAAYGGHLVGAAAGDAGGLWLMGWSRAVGDLRVPHFFATHVMHAVPLGAALLVPVFGRERMAPSLVLTLAYCAFVALVFWQALNGAPFMPWLG